MKPTEITSIFYEASVIAFAGIDNLYYLTTRKFNVI